MRKLITTFMVFSSLMTWSICSDAMTFHFTVSGIKGNLLENAKTTLEANQKLLAKPFIADEIKAFHEDAPKEIQKALQPYGYFKSQIISQLQRRNDDWYASYHVIPGEALKITKLDLAITGAGANEPDFKKLKEDFPIQAGQTLNIEQYNLAKRNLFDTAFDNGYLDAKFSKKVILIDLKHHKITIILHFATGPRYFIGPIYFAPSLYNPDFLRRFLTFSQNQIYSHRALEESRNALNNSNLFRSVDISPQLEKKQNQHVPIKVKVKPRKAKQYDFGLGYGTDTGARGLIGVELRHIGANGHRFNSTLRLSEVKSNLEAHYLIPGKHPATDLYDLSAMAEHQDQDFGRSTTFQLAAAYLTVVKNWQQTMKLSLHHENYRLTDYPSNNSLLLMPSISWLHTTADDPIIPNQGYTIKINIQGAAKALLSSTDFLQTTIYGKYVHPIFTKKLQIALRGTLGYTAIDEINDLPLSLQYFAGGTLTVRGYDYNSIGPGKGIALASAELRYRVFGNWYGIAFFDAGSVNDNLFEQTKKGAGIGILWRSPIGLAELTYAQALDRKGHPGLIQFNIGPEF